MKRCDGPGLDAWRGAWTPAEVTARLSGLDISWCVVGGWAIDLWLGRQTREHGDLEIAILRPDLARVRAHLADFRFYAVGDGEVIALDEPSPDKHQTWIEDPRTQLWCVDVMLELGDAETWIYRRDPTIRRARSLMIGRTADGIPYLQPEGMLLFKAKAVRPKDEADFAVAAPLLSREAKAWLRDALAHAHPGHPWLAALTAA